MKIWTRIYSTWCLLVFVGVYLFSFPFFWIIIQKKCWHKYSQYLNRLIVNLFFTFAFIPVDIEYRGNLDRKRQYVFCANHFSFLDIALFAFIHKHIVFIGKKSISKVPLFGYMYRKLHILVDRGNLKSKYQTVELSKKAIEEGKSVVIFPEGGIVSKNPPEMGVFKDGAFKVAIEKQIPLVPVTIPFNWIILPDENNLQVYRKRARIIFHEPIETVGKTLNDLEELKSKSFQIINMELQKQNYHES